MSRTSGYRLSVMIFAMAVCLTMPACRTCTETAYDDGAVSDAARETRCKLKEIIIPEMAFPLHATITDAVEFLKQASREYDKPQTFSGERGVRFDLRLPPAPQPVDRNPADPFIVSIPTNLVHAMFAAMSVRSISLYDALQLVCDVSRMSWEISGNGTVFVTPEVWPDGDVCYGRSFTVPQALANSLFRSRDGQSSDADPNKVWQDFFEQLDVKGPASATVDEYLPAIGKLRVTNTLENLAKIDQIFEKFALRMVEVEMQIHAFRTADIERLRLSGGMSLESLMALRKNGKAKQVASATALTKSGQEAIVKSVKEVIYPTELLANVGQADSNVPARSAGTALMPGSFTMRETGMILEVVPEVIQSGSLINLVLRPQWVTLEGWESYRADQATVWTYNTLSLKQPVFGVTSFETQAAVKDGETLLLGSCSTPDGEWVHIGFLTARFMDTQVAVSDKKDLQQKARNDAEILKKLKRIVIPDVTFRKYETIFDALRFFTDASMKYDNPTVAKAHRGVGFLLRLPVNSWDLAENSMKGDPFVAPAHVQDSGLPLVPAFSAYFISLYDALKLVCDVTQMKFMIRDGVVWIVPDYGADEKYNTRIYAVPPSASHPCASCEKTRSDAPFCKDDNDNQDWKKFYERLGVNWAPGSSINYLASIGLLRVTNSRENLDAFEQVLEKWVHPRMIEVDVQIHAFPTEEIEKLRLSGDMSVETLMALRKAGRGNPIASAMVVTKSGQEAIVKAVREMLYPAELSNTSGEGAGALIPASFEMREVGMILQVTPEIAATEQPKVHLTIKPQWVTQEGWESYPAAMASVGRHKTLPFKKPLFRTTSFESQILVNVGKTVLLGSRSTPDGKWVQVGFLTVK